jgi:hypothetical protein
MIAVGLAELLSRNVSALHNRDKLCAIGKRMGEKEVILFDQIDHRSERNGQFFHSVRPVAGVLQNLYDSGDNLVIDVGIIDFALRLG